MNASSFADKIGVQRSSISHLLSGRNKPSLDFVMKILDIFPDVNLYWVLNGKGNLLKDEIGLEVRSQTQNQDDHTPILNSNIQEEKNAEEKIHVSISKDKASEFQNLKNGSDIFKIVFFYKDGTFKDFHP